MSKEKVFKAMQRAIPTIKGLTIEIADKLQGRFIVKAGVSLYSWGENIPIQLTEISENRTRVNLTSSPKTGNMFGGSSDMGKNRKNIEDILFNTSKILSDENEQLSTETILDKPLMNNQVNNYQTVKNSNLMQTNNSSSWYEKKWLVIILCIIFFPIGLYALWKNTIISKGWKISIIIISLIVFTNFNNKKPTQPTPNENTSTVPIQPEMATEEQEKSPTQKEAIITKLKEKAKRDWPNDYTTQEFWVNQQIDDYEYMLSIENNSIKAKAEKDWPLDFSTQKFWYNEQIDAQERME
ncbi:hypothetical protein [Flavobacterium sp.]|uniref:hypothetical protein n=1 Tax=Flavobacterium sp. TaxID=239 RepID=UPI00374DF1CD